MLYASAQSPEDTPSLIVIGVFYGLVTYIVSRLALRWLNPAVFAVWRTLAGIYWSTRVWCNVGGFCHFS